MEMDNPSTYGLRLDQMADLFAIGAEGSDAATEKADDETLRALLAEQLNCIKPKGSLVRETLVMMLNAPGPLADKPLSQVLLSGDFGVDLLRAIKDASKTLSCSLDSATETALARTIYFAAIAAALVHHDAIITQNTYATLADSLATLIAKPWIGRDLGQLLSRARNICRSRQDGA